MTDFAAELLRALSAIEAIATVTLESEGPIVKGRAYLASSANTFLDVYYNDHTGTVAFALVQERHRIWGIDHDSARGWHLHPLQNPTAHITIEPASVSEMVNYLASALRSLSDQPL